MTHETRFLKYSNFILCIEMKLNPRPKYKT